MTIKRKSNVKRIFDIIAILVFAMIAWILIRSFIINPQRLKGKGVRFTIAVVNSLQTPSDGGEDANFDYEVEGKKYTGFFIINGRFVNIGDRFYLKFLVDDPNVCEIVFSDTVSDSIKTIPKEGWQYLP